ncbi:cupin domain-containing protein [Inhella gelatinilytica]|uniref:Cupin domain-containing protein n=1 Tax=Inhella gelatinilytica TaxID=2795030 RepID=A0A931IWW8_9BURK|nr:cupin domain-containing protein [Inhella gelatinilytica]MBH9553061.1 cupin domain-containing protein [Inhella gelatinilytica]
MNTAPLPTDALSEAPPHAHARAPEPGPAAELLLALASEGLPPPLGLSERLSARIAAQRAANAPLVTLHQPLQRRSLQPWGPGVRACALHGNSWLVEAEAGSALPAPTAPLELLVLAGSVAVAGQPLSLSTAGYALLPAGQALTALGAVRLYWREHRAGPFSAPDQALLRTPQDWQPLRDGVSICPLHGEGAAVSLLARLQPGARVPAHPHGIDEECLMVEGDLFLGDVLLREGEYQFAPAGSQHGDLFADAPCLLFFHGAIEAAAIDNPHRVSLGWPPLGG